MATVGDPRPGAWLLPAGHPDLCPGAGTPCVFDPAYRRTVCPSCGAGTGADQALTVAGGGRVGQHYPADPPRALRRPDRCRVDAYGRPLAPGEAPSPPPGASVPGQLDLFTPEETPHDL